MLHFICGRLGNEESRHGDIESEPGGEAGWDHATYEKQIASEKERERESGSVLW